MMGDRANVYVKNTDDVGVYLYTHWNGSELPDILRTALARKQRWDDDAYLARIIFDEMTRGMQGEETGYGISAVLGDGGDRVLVVDCDSRTVTVGPYGRPIHFREYIEMTDLTWTSLRQCGAGEVSG